MSQRFGSLRVLAVLVGVLAVFAVVGVVLASANAKGIDNFLTGNFTLNQVDPDDNLNVIVSTRAVAAAGAIGGQRTVVFTTTFLPNQADSISQLRVNIAGKVFQISSPTGAIPDAFMKWDGTNVPLVLSPSGLGGVDLISGTNTGFVIEIKQDDLAFDLGIRVYSGTNTSVYTVTLPGNVDAGSHVDYFVPFSNFVVEEGSPVNFASIGAISWRIAGVDSLDFQVTNYESDNVKEFGDLPDTYSTLLTSNGPRHEVTFLRLGANIDSEATGQPSVNALGDDNDGNAPYLPGDEDGVTDRTGAGPDYTKWFTGTNGGSINVTMNGCPGLSNCYFNGWIDWGNDGTFNQVGDQVLTNYTLSGNGTRLVHFNIPTTFATFPAQLYARFRLCSTSGGCSTYDGAATDGEVEDYVWGFNPLAVTLNNLEAKADTQNNTAALILAATVVAALGLAGVALRRRTA